MTNPESHPDFENLVNEVFAEAFKADPYLETDVIAANTERDVAANERAILDALIGNVSSAEALQSLYEHLENFIHNPTSNDVANLIQKKMELLSDETPEEIAVIMKVYGLSSLVGMIAFYMVYEHPDGKAETQATIALTKN